MSVYVIFSRIKIIHDIMLTLTHCDPSWHEILQSSLEKMDKNYLNSLIENDNWLPGKINCLNAFSLPLSNIKYILFGESPYPRQASANGYAFWDSAVTDLWSDNGLSKKVNRATSLRNFIKMLCIAENKLTSSLLSQSAIADLNKDNMIQTVDQLFNHMLDEGFLLLNTTLALSNNRPKEQEARFWYPFIETLLMRLNMIKPDVTLMLWGKVAKKIEQFPIVKGYKTLYAEHPYNLSFINNVNMLKFFSQFNLLDKKR